MGDTQNQSYFYAIVIVGGASYIDIEEERGTTSLTTPW